MSQTKVGCSSLGLECCRDKARFHVLAGSWFIVRFWVSGPMIVSLETTTDCAGIT